MRRLAFVLALAAGCDEPRPPVARTEVREPCASASKTRNVYFGDLHVHTGVSFDARANGVDTTPADAYRFARGQPIELLGRSLSLDRPLDFAAVTDHSEFFGEVSVCHDERAPAYASSGCESYRRGGLSGTSFIGGLLGDVPPRRLALCADGGCDVAARSVWAETQAAAEAAYDRSAACRFTSFVGYEYSVAPQLSNLHRNVIFRNANVQAAPTSAFEAFTPSGLWRRLAAECTAAAGCEAIVIPHNSNLSNGRMFDLDAPENGGPGAIALRAELERLVEIYQHKGDSECQNGLAAAIGAEDELCDFEKILTADCGEGTGEGGLAGFGCVSGRDLVRTALVLGLAHQRDHGTNPLKLGIIASTDSHNATPGAVDDPGYPGHFGGGDDEPAERLKGPSVPPGALSFSPGGLAAVWAEENSRDAIFEALRRRETFGTSGPRLAVRFFAGADLPEDLCARPDWLEVAYAKGTPMGGDVRPAGPMRLVVSAIADAGSRRGVVPLERVQIVKGSLTASGPKVEVIDLAPPMSSGFVTDPATCAATGTGETAVCRTYVDASYDPAAPTVYYARVVERPTCRWSQSQCLALPAELRPPACTDGRVPALLRERAWTSPIWSTPE